MKISEVRTGISQAINDAQSAPIPIERHGQQVAWLVSDEQFQRLTFQSEEMRTLFAQLSERFPNHTEHEIVIRLIRDWAYREEGGESKTAMLKTILEIVQRIEQKVS